MVKGYKLKDIEYTLNSKQSMLYGVSVGYSNDPLDKNDL